MSKVNKQYDVIIAGGGMVGATVATLLAQGGKQVAVIEAYETAELASDAQYELRVSALSRQTQRVLEQVGAWQGVESRRCAPYESMFVWDATGEGEIRFDAAELGEANLGHIVENRVVQLALQEVIAQSDLIDWYCPERLQSFTATDETIQVILHGGETLQAQLLVGADGAASRVRQQAGIALNTQDYGQQGVVAVIKTSQAHEWTAWQRFLPTGPLAFLPLGDEHHCSIVWTLPSDQADAVVNLSSDSFNQKLAQALDYRLGEVEAVSQVAAFPLKGRHAESYIAQRVALVGDAAHTIHPLAGQGVNLGIKDAAALADQLLATTGDLGSVKTLRRYERARKADNHMTQKAMEGFKVLFGNDMPMWRVLRNKGLSLMNQTGFVKNQMVKHAMGI